MRVIDPNTPEGRAEMERRWLRRQAWDNAIIVAIVVTIIVAIAAIDLLGNEWFYGDWKCAFTHCVRVQDIREPRKP